MKRPLRVLFISLGSAKKASSRVRAFWIASELEQLGIECVVQWQDSKSDWVRGAWEVCKSDVVIFQKTYSRWHIRLLKFAKFIGKRTYVDIDDYPAPTMVSQTLRNFEMMLVQSDGALAGCPALLEYVRPFQENSSLLRTGIRPEDYAIKDYESPDANAVCLGWTGNGNAYAKDIISVLTVPLAAIANEFKVHFKLVGSCGRPELYESFQRIPGLTIECIDTLEWDDPAVVSSALGEFDIGLFPLLNEHYNEFKCGFKALEYMAMGIPVIASPVGINSSVIDHGKDGLLAADADEWVSSLRTLIVDPKKRKAIGLAGREKVESQFNVATIAKELNSILNGTNKVSKGG